MARLALSWRIGGLSWDFFFLVLLVTTVAQSDSTSSFGFDSANSCSPNGKISRRGRAQMLAAIPCDLAKQPFCHLPGSIYPWHAVRRFVHENQGLMKRMYGDVRHISILRDEIQNEEVADMDSMDDATQRYSKTPRGAKYMLHGRESNRDEFGNYKSNDVLMEPHFRPVSTASTTTTPTTTAAPTLSTAPTPSSSNSKTSSAPTEVVFVHPDGEQPSLDSNSVYDVMNTTAATGTAERPQGTAIDGADDKINTIDKPQLELVQEVDEGLRNLSIASVPVTPATSTTAASQLSAAVPIRKQSPNESDTSKMSAGAASDKATQTNTTPTSIAPLPKLSNNSTTTAALVPRRNVTKTILGTTTPVSFASLFSPTLAAFTSDKQRKPLTASSTAAPTSSTKSGLLREGQLFQDAMKQEPMAVSSNMRGVNACPVKDEVVAPFWANNTRGEVLALLNLYPFEQYVHWEKCTHEFKQMFCRDGCRCEQQYRLHRLLAYDPHNECRGIFSDWFRFPSSCICKCYNIPLDFRATSRSPRSENSFNAPQSLPQSYLDAIEVAETEVQRAIYEHATDQWYRPRDEFDFFEG
ncbi:protein spaetzle 4 [Drosophila novamexicana]|uniref:protein spaetzle 4 n=1 Tax=Drosophila novamexicana TaxID=47314 RepID=UPI0011E5FADF|nr:protein spaetzle 4 [Drosophila novamexicana]